jgi:hypothetical protein
VCLPFLAVPPAVAGLSAVIFGGTGIICGTAYFQNVKHGFVK